ncbi:hypothetical protein Lepto7376_3839 [[Leptolyngbya] sp. PCC 7376]|uniref:hypothetical protein n=1 Tax=[Leptolyngbya] sp. PCC 7376 TaxID=111781 RepID=UPI00029F4BA0|nr:hypothetical protein [[Leptolyngbya] sp. PCC 7376]AFY39996.1 hypothetical protein Lepto7376_3839 [[Leptolyngbya] sp. PCC 7376]
MAVPCNSKLDKAPFQTYRDPETGEWQIEKGQVESSPNYCKVLPFRRSTQAFAEAKRKAK